MSSRNHNISGKTCAIVSISFSSFIDQGCPNLKKRLIKKFQWMNMQTNFQSNIVFACEYPPNSPIVVKILPCLFG